MSLAHRALAALLAVAGLVALAIPAAATAQAQSAAPDPVFFNNDSLSVVPLPGTLADWRLDTCGLAIRIVNDSNTAYTVTANVPTNPITGDPVNVPGDFAPILPLELAAQSSADLVVSDQLALAVYTTNGQSPDRTGNTQPISLTATSADGSLQFGASVPAMLDPSVARGRDCVKDWSLSDGSLEVDFGPNTLADGRTESCGLEVVLTNNSPQNPADVQLWVAPGVRPPTETDPDPDQAIALPGAAATVPPGGSATVTIDDVDLLAEFTAQETESLRVFAQYANPDDPSVIWWEGAIPWPSVLDPSLRESCDVQVQQTTTTTVASTSTTVAPTTTTVVPTTTAPQQVVVLQSTLPVTGSTHLATVAGGLMLLASGLVCMAGRRNLLVDVRS